MSEYIHKSHKVSVLLNHLVCPAKYRRVVFTDEVDTVLNEICLEIAKRYEIQFFEIGVDRDHVHFLIQSVPMYSPTRVAKIIKSITAREIFVRFPSVKKARPSQGVSLNSPRAAKSLWPGYPVACCGVVHF